MSAAVCRYFQMPVLRALVVIAGLAGVVQPGFAERFDPPDLAGFTRDSEREADGDDDGVKETLIVKYLNPDGDSIVSMTTKDRLWAWSMESLKDDSGPHNYVIRDSDCDGIFDEVYGLDAKFYLPDCLK